MHCYNCKDITLKPTRIDGELTGRQCGQCQGLHIDLLAYRTWLDGHRSDEDTVHGSVTPHAESVPEEIADSSKALVCQRCSRIMLKYRISTDHENHVDLCGHCDDVWLDQGEWALLRALRLEHKLTAITTEPWQKNVRAEAIARVNEAHIENKLGEAAVSELQRFVQWVQDCEHQAEAIRYLRHHLKI